MDTTMTFQIDENIKQQMSAICKELGMTTSTAFNLFANAFVQAKGMPFPLESQMQSVPSSISVEKMIEDADKILKEFASDYEEMAK